MIPARLLSTDDLARIPRDEFVPRAWVDLLLGHIAALEGQSPEAIATRLRREGWIAAAKHVAKEWK